MQRPVGAPAAAVDGDDLNVAAAFRRGRRRKMHALRVQIMTKNRAELIGFHFAHERRAAPQRRKTGDRIRGRATGHFDGGSYHVVECRGTFRVDQRHGSPRNFVLAQKFFRCVRENVNERVTYRANIESCRRHEDRAVRG